MFCYYFLEKEFFVFWWEIERGILNGLEDGEELDRIEREEIMFSIYYMRREFV